MASRLYPSWPITVISGLHEYCAQQNEVKPVQDQYASAQATKRWKHFEHPIRQRTETVRRHQDAHEDHDRSSYSMQPSAGLTEAAQAVRELVREGRDQ